MPFNLPIFLTWLRILAIPLLILVFNLPPSWLTPLERNLFATLLFIAAALTDWLDGFLARRLNQTSAFGAFLDPVADKLIVAAALFMLVELDRTNAAVAVIIIGREITISALREWMAKIGAAKSVAVSMIGKIKTTAQMIAIILLLYGAPIPILGWSTLAIGNVLIWVAALLTLWSMGYYLHKAWPEIARRSASTS
ncbi:MAG: CDP-diacylglycerol--glycerol-3-phosphate 3-phosphatidyltransferase [Zoogloeaceae bacterium]|jgi:CDP-diacylglycerol--glycerol-3-phosphate 3-phosphatidyltransferase/cardiolipin synthase|nr:CDP-diacylglycerol--glycerol-3-phosphate 3-phosphatidyltransferase [Zoogloeaceae bacterium]